MKHVVMDPETGDVIATYQNVAGMWRFYERSASYLAQDLGAGRPMFDEVVLDAHRAKGTHCHGLVTASTRSRRITCCRATFHRWVGPVR
jgi:hypothetical protein